MNAELLQRIALALPALFVALTVHEYAHARVATWLGDETPRREGRLTLSPLAHLDPIGSVLFPLLLLLAPGGFGLFGWARPVRFRPVAFRRSISMRTGAALTAAAGPLSNVLLALVALALLRTLATAGWAGRAPGFESFLHVFYSLNLILAVFNLLPIPPLDGHYLLPQSLDPVVEWMQRYSLIVFVVVVFVPIPGLGTTVASLLMVPLANLLGRALETIVFW